MRLIIFREKREVVDGVQRTISKARQYAVRDLSKDFDTLNGKFAKKDLSAPSGSIIKTDQGKEALIMDASFIDVHKRLRKFAQTIPLKDIGLILAETGINKDSIIVEGGVGSGALSASLANVAKKVISYEVRDESEKTASENLKEMDIKNVTIKRASLYDDISEKDVDAIILDVPEPWNVVKHAAKALKVGGFLVSYSPSLAQVSKVADEVRKHDVLLYQKSVELIERLWVVDGERLRPKNTPIGHSGFIVFVRKVKAF